MIIISQELSFPYFDHDHGDFSATSFLFFLTQDSALCSPNCEDMKKESL